STEARALVVRVLFLLGELAMRCVSRVELPALSDSVSSSSSASSSYMEDSASTTKQGSAGVAKAVPARLVTLVQSLVAPRVSVNPEYGGLLSWLPALCVCVRVSLCVCVCVCVCACVCLCV